MTIVDFLRYTLLALIVALLLAPVVHWVGHRLGWWDW